MPSMPHERYGEGAILDSIYLVFIAFLFLYVYLQLKKADNYTMYVLLNTMTV